MRNYVYFVLLVTVGCVHERAHGATRSRSAKSSAELRADIRSRTNKLNEILRQLDRNTGAMERSTQFAGICVQHKQCACKIVIQAACGQAWVDIQTNTALTTAYRKLADENDADRLILRKRAERMHDFAGVAVAITAIVIAGPRFLAGVGVPKTETTRAKPQLWKGVLAGGYNRRESPPKIHITVTDSLGSIKTPPLVEDFAGHVDVNARECFP